MAIFFNTCLGCGKLRTGCLVISVIIIVLSLVASYVTSYYLEGGYMPREWWQFWSIVYYEDQRNTRIVIVFVFGIPFSFVWGLLLLIGALARREGVLLLAIIIMLIQMIVYSGFHWYLLFWHQFSPNFRIHFFCSVFMWFHCYYLCVMISYYCVLIKSKKLTDEDYMTNSFILPHRRPAARLMEELEEMENPTLEGKSKDMGSMSEKSDNRPSKDKH